MPFQLEWFSKWILLLGDDPTRAGLIGTPGRMSSALEEMLGGYKEDPREHLSTVFAEPAADEIDPVRIDVPFVSLCEHHVLPFFGSVGVDYLPAGTIVGLSKVPRAVHTLARRLQTQERLTVEIADAFYDSVSPHWVDVTIKATHLCVEARGARSHCAVTTKATRGR